MFVTKANLLHDRVHNPDNNYISKGKRIFTSVPVYNDQEQYNLYAVSYTHLFEDFSTYKQEIFVPEINTEKVIGFLLQDCKNKTDLVVDKFTFLTRYCFSCLTDADSLDTACLLYTSFHFGKRRRGRM